MLNCQCLNLDLKLIHGKFGFVLINIPLTKFEGRTISYSPFPPLIYGPSAKLVGHKPMGRTRRTHLLHIVSVCLMGSDTHISIHVEWLQISDARQKQNKSI